MTIPELVAYHEDIFATLRAVALAAANHPEAYVNLSDLLKLTWPMLETFGDDIPGWLRPEDFAEVQQFVWEYIDSDHPDFPLADLDTHVLAWFSAYSSTNFPD